LDGPVWSRRRVRLLRADLPSGGAREADLWLAGRVRPGAQRTDW